MKRKVLVVFITLVLILSVAVPVYAGPGEGGGGVLPPIPPIPTSIGICLTAFQSDCYTTCDDNKCNCSLDDDSKTYNS